MSNLGVILPIIIAATLGAGAIYFMSGNEEENKPNFNNPNNNSNNPQYEYNNSPERMSTDSYDSSSGQEAAIGGFKTKRHKNKYMKKKSKSKSRRRSSKKSKK